MASICLMRESWEVVLAYLLGKLAVCASGAEPEGRILGALARPRATLIRLRGNAPDRNCQKRNERNRERDEIPR